MTKSRRFYVVPALVLAFLLLGLIIWWLRNRVPPTTMHTPNAASNPPRVAVRFGMLPYGDHTYAIIGVRKGWFEEAGISLDYRAIKVEEIIPFLKGNSLDVVSCPPGILFASHDNAPGLISFVFGDLFQGYAIMASPQVNPKSYSEFVAEGLTPEAGMRAAVAQMKGKTFAYPTEAAIKPFIDVTLRKGGISRNDLRSLVLDDPLTINAMRNGQAQFQVGGVPSRLVLQREGFKPIVRSIDLAKTAKPSPDSEELAGILQNGWATTRAYYQKNRDTILRLASVNYRIMRFINEHPQEALSIHMPYLSQISGETFSNKEGMIIYTDLDPFFSFEEQYDWFHNRQSPLYYLNVNGSILQNFVKQGTFKSPPPAVEDVIWADDVYRELAGLKSTYGSLLKKAESAALHNPSAKEKLQAARTFYDNYNYLDAARVLREVTGGN